MTDKPDIPPKKTTNGTIDSHESANWVRCPTDDTNHPVVYLSTETDGVVSCPYCGAEYNKNKGHK